MKTSKKYSEDSKESKVKVIMNLHMIIKKRLIKN